MADLPPEPPGRLCQTGRMPCRHESCTLHAEALPVCGDAAVAEAIGVNAIPEIEVVNLVPSHLFLVLASDGVFEFMSNEDVVQLVRCSSCLLPRCTVAQQNDPRVVHAVAAVQCLSCVMLGSTNFLARMILQSHSRTVAGLCACGRLGAGCCSTCLTHCMPSLT